uniref:Phospholipase A2 inhibitor and Ly6/PLAUR domain-containing protein-like n=1 Tax=Gouania willdenowi TaxID=441366 RepID=A0A8C5E4B1_GOUWI
MHIATLFFGFVLFPRVPALQCHECDSESCQTKECLQGEMCGALTFVSFAGSLNVYNVTTKSCILREHCTDASVNFGIARTVLTSQCCSTDLCNAQLAYVPIQNSLNGRQCTSCDGLTCGKTLQCIGNEDQCITAKVTMGEQAITMKGCSSKLFCSLPDVSSFHSVAQFGQDIQCCEGNLCNSASSTNTGLLLLVVSLTSYVLLY